MTHIPYETDLRVTPIDKTTILIVEDEKDIRELLAYHLERENFTTVQAGTGKLGIDLAKSSKPDLVLLDIMLPDMDGLSVCRELKQDPLLADTPIIMATAKGEEIDRIVGLELGADDYIVKPFSLREVVLRVKAILRRGTQKTHHGIIQYGPIAINSPAHTVTINNTPLALTLTEFRLLEDLCQNKGTVRTREQLLDAIWGHSFEGYSRTIDTHVRRLRAKLGEYADIIETIRGIGYRAKEDETW